MISKYIKFKLRLDEITPVVDVNNLSLSFNEYWNLSSHKYENWVWKKDVFSDFELNKIIKIGTYLGLDRAQTGGQGKDCLNIRRSFVSWLNINSETSWIYEKLTDEGNLINNEWFEFDLEKIEKLQFTYYSSEENGCYKPHVDPMCWSSPHNRKLSFVVQLSDPNEYEGGELQLHYGDTPTIIPKEKGLIVFFPSYILHEVTQVTKGNRYTLVGWVHGKAFK